MSLVARHKCPSCHRVVSISAVRERMKGQFFIGGNKVGVLCDKCGVQLRVRRLLAFLTVASAVVCAMVLIFYLLMIRQTPKGSPEYVLGLLGAMLPVLGAHWLAPYLVVLEQAAPGEQLFVFADSWDTPQSRAERLQEEASMGEPFRPEPTGSISVAAAQSWQCPACSSYNPANFETCWKCNHGQRPSNI